MLSFQGATDPARSVGEMWGHAVGLSQLGQILDSGHILLSSGRVLELLWLQVISDSQEGHCPQPVMEEDLGTVHLSVASFGLCARAFLIPGLRVMTPGHCQSALIRLEAAPRAMVSPSEPGFSDLWKFHLVSFISPPPSPPNKKIKSWPSLAFLRS